MGNTDSNTNNSIQDLLTDYSELRKENNGTVLV